MASPKQIAAWWIKADIESIAAALKRWKQTRSTSTAPQNAEHLIGTPDLNDHLSVDQNDKTKPILDASTQ